MQFERAVDTRNIGQPLAIRAQCRRNVVITGESDPLSVAARGGNPVDLRRAAAITHKINGTAIRRVNRLGINRGRLHQALGLAPVRVHHIQLRTPVTAEGKSNRAAVRRPSGGAVRALETGDQSTAASGHVVDIHHRLSCFKRNIGQLVAVGRPRGGNNGLRATQGALCILTICVCYPQVVGAARLGHIRNTRRKNAFVTRQTFIDKVCNAVGRQTQVAC